MEPIRFGDEQFNMLIFFRSSLSKLMKKTSILTVSNNKNSEKSKQIRFVFTIFSDGMELKKSLYPISQGNIIYLHLTNLLKSKNDQQQDIFKENINKLEQITCFSNEGNKWRNSKISFIEKNTLEIKISEKFVGERGRINCSLREINGFWRWLGIQFVVSEK